MLGLSYPSLFCIALHKVFILTSKVLKRVFDTFISLLQMKNHVISKICQVQIDGGLERIAQISVILNKATKDDTLVLFNTTV